MNGLPDWLTNEAISNYIIFFGGLLVGLIVWIIRTKYLESKPAIIRVEKQNESSLLNIAAEARDRLDVTFRGQRIIELHQATYTVTNTSEKPIENVNMVFCFEKESPDDIIEIAFEDPLDGIRAPVVWEVSFPDNNREVVVKLSAPYLNPHKEYEDSLTIQLYSPKPTPIKTVNGGGLGWTAKYFDKVAYNKRIERIVSESNSITELAVNLILRRFIL